ncbi:hypothetical protein evm_011536 [Chilo suppressalis]|nr:hypothetical protein evm_011536 [Chilo suppressalis]
MESDNELPSPSTTPRKKAKLLKVKQHLTSKKMRKSSGLLQKFFPKTSASTSGLSSPTNEDTKFSRVSDDVPCC